MLERIPRWAIDFCTRKASDFRHAVIDFCAGRAIDSIVVIKAEKAVVNRIEELMAQGGIPLVYADHQGHFDGAAFAKLTRFFRTWAAKVDYDLKGLVAPMAVSWATGDQGEDLKAGYDLMKGAGQKIGFEGIQTTRVKDEEEYDLRRDHIVRESLRFARMLRKGYGLATLPEGSVQGGRHPKGASIEEIYGMQKVKGHNLIGFYSLMRREKIHADQEEPNTGREAFFVPVGLHGSFRLIESPDWESPEGNKIKPRITPQGKRSLILGVLGIPFGLSRIRANVLMPFTVEDIIKDLGPDWRERVLEFNDYAMRRLKPGLPPQAWGYYGQEEATNQTTAIEVSQPS